MQEANKPFRILVTHAEDVKKELDSIERAVKRFNDLFSNFLQRTLVTCKWESNSNPTNLCERPQEAVNNQLVTPSDACIAVFRTRFGSPRGGKDKNGNEYQSGSEEEIAVMAEQRKQIFVYFLSDEVVKAMQVSEIDVEQYGKVKQFQREYGKKYLYAVYNDSEDSYKSESDLEYQLFNHLCNFFIRDREFLKSNINDDMYMNLLGGFCTDYPNDITIVEQFTQKSAEQVYLLIERLQELVRTKGDNADFKIDENHISVANRVSFWGRIGSEYRDKGLFQRFQNIAVQVLSAPTDYSRMLVSGFAETLAILGNQSSVFTGFQTPSEIKCFADNVIAFVFPSYDRGDKAKVVLEKLCNHASYDILSLLAESSPEYFLRAIDEVSQDTTFKCHSNLKWAMERLAFDYHHTMAVCVILARFAQQSSTDREQDSNSPIHSIATILWNVVIFDEDIQDKWDETKLAVLKYLIDNHPVLSAKIIKSLVFQPSASWGTVERDGKEYPGTFPHYMRLNLCRKYGAVGNPRLMNEYIKLILDASKSSFHILKCLVENLNNCSKSLIDQIIESFSADFVKELDNEKRYEIWDAVKVFLQRNRRFRNADWTYSEDFLKKMEAALPLIEPNDDILKAAWYFTRYADDISDDAWIEAKHDWKAEERKCTQIRKEIVDKIISSNGISSIIKLYNVAKDKNRSACNAIAITLSELDSTEIDVFLLPDYLLDEFVQRLLDVYIRNRFRTQEAVERFVSESTLGWSKEQKCAFVCALAIPYHEINILLEDDTHLIDEYWKKADVFTDDEETLRKLLEKDRFELLFQNLHDNKKTSTAFIVECLKAVLSKDELLINMWNIRSLLEKVFVDDSIDDTTKEDLEWLSLKFYQPYSDVITPKRLLQKLETDVELLRNSIVTAAENSSKFSKGAENYLLWLWNPRFSCIENFRGWYESVIEGLAERPLRYFHKLLGRKLFKKNQDEIVWMSDEIAKVMDESSEILSAYSAAARGIGDMDDLRLGVRDRAFYSTLESEAPFWQNKAEEMNQKGFIRMASTLRIMAADMLNPRGFYSP